MDCLRSEAGDESLGGRGGRGSGESRDYPEHGEVITQELYSGHWLSSSTRNSFESFRESPPCICENVS